MSDSRRVKIILTVMTIMNYRIMVGRRYGDCKVKRMKVRGNTERDCGVRGRVKYCQARTCYIVGNLATRLAHSRSAVILHDEWLV
jgi:hypothetical protein